jgi:hypothetical protein
MDILLFTPVVLGASSHSVDLDKYCISRKFGSRTTRSKLIIEYVCCPLDMTVEQAAHFMQRMCNEVPPNELITLQLGTSIAYQRKDNGKFVKAPTIIKHIQSKDKSQIYTLVGFENNGKYISDSRRKKIASGAILGPTRYTNQTWIVASDSIERLFVVKSEINMMDEEINTLKKALSKACDDITERDKKIDALIKAVNTLKGAVSIMLNK